MYLFWQKRRVHNTETPNTLRKTGRWLGSSSDPQATVLFDCSQRAHSSENTKFAFYALLLTNFSNRSRLCVLQRNEHNNIVMKIPTITKDIIMVIMMTIVSHQGRARAQRTAEFPQKTVPYCSPEYIVSIIRTSSLTVSS